MQDGHPSPRGSARSDRNASVLARTGWRHGARGAEGPCVAALKPMSRMDRSASDTADEGTLLACAQWLEDCLASLPDRGARHGWKEAVLRRQQRRDAEFAIAAALQRRGGSRTTVTTSPDLGTTIRIFGVRASSTDGFEAACRDWIEKARTQHLGKACRIDNETM